MVQFDAWRAVGENGAVIERHCPECWHSDELSVNIAVADVLNEHAAELTTSLEELADCLESASELWISR
ncbi:MAG TPA: hypothetical protein VFD90_09130 [Gaiellales bacterium]|nr:hypothetical protein [Gaiellales bacterium]